MSYQDIDYQVSGGVGTLTLNRPDKLNAFRNQTLDECSEVFEAAREDGAVGVVVLTGSGSKAFCVGGDISEMKDLTPLTGRDFVRRLRRFAKAVLELDKPLIAKVRGYCLGGGHEIHLMCDLTYADTTARFGQTGPKVGSVPLWGATQILPQVVGQKRAREIIYLCDPYSAEEARTMGLINGVSQPDQLDDDVAAVCRSILEKSPQSLRLSRRNLNAAIPWSLWVDALEDLQGCYGSAELTEGMNAFLEKRPPRFRDL